MILHLFIYRDDARAANSLRRPLLMQSCRRKGKSSLSCRRSIINAALQLKIKAIYPDSRRGVFYICRSKYFISQYLCPACAIRRSKFRPSLNLQSSELIHFRRQHNPVPCEHPTCFCRWKIRCIRRDQVSSWRWQRPPSRQLRRS